ncbi:unnamed protein product [Diatraea saccharalis]|uniref:Zinc finger PHD-type domain-containing protein n=1 Tax=Diatraea saccharalis TaxID=40085 RepID=A0A9N9R3B2_9NEOP|nr:unnamed protein product [Diatraea saccharalis]
MNIILGHISPVAGPSTQELVDEQRTPISFAAIATTPAIASSSKPGHRKRKQHATILTATPMKISLENKEKKKIAKHNKARKDDKSRPKPVVEGKKNKQMKQKSYKRKFLQESSSETEDEEHLCDDDSDDEMIVDNEDYNNCIICEEFGKNNELWYRCTTCGLWAHAICSGWETPDEYVCDLCIQNRKMFEDLTLVCDGHLASAAGRKFSNASETVNNIKSVSPNITEVFFGCKWKDIPKETCENLFAPILTEEGLCYTFNMLSAEELFRVENLHDDYPYLERGLSRPDNLTTFWNLENGYPPEAPIETYPHRGSGYGAKAGLTFLMKTKEIDLDYLCKGPVQGFKADDKNATTDKTSFGYTLGQRSYRGNIVFISAFKPWLRLDGTEENIGASSLKHT